MATGFQNGAVKVDDAATSRTNLSVPSTTGSGASGTWGISISGSSASSSGNAATATALQTARAINGTNFDGTAAITVPVNTTSTSTNTTYFPLFVASSTNGNQSVNLSTGYTFNPSTNTLSTTTFAGALSGNAATATILATARAIYGNNFDGSAALSQIIASTYGGTGNGFTKFTGATTSEKTYTLPNANCTILTTNAAVTETQGGTNQTTYTTGDTLYSSASNTLSKLAGNTSATMAVLTQTGNGSISAAPVWTSTTGTGNVVRATSPTLTTPSLGTPSALNLSNATSLPMAAINSGTVNSFTPHLQDSSGHDYSMTTQFGAYIQLGQMYFVWIFISWNGKGSAVSTDQIKITNLPLTATVSRGAGCIGGNNGLGTGTQCNISTDVDIGANYAWIWRNVTGTSSQMLVSQTATSGEVQAFYCYY